MLSHTGVRKLKPGATVRLAQATHVRFVKQEDGSWAEVPRMGIEPRVKTTAELFLLGVEPVEGS